MEIVVVERAKLTDWIQEQAKMAKKGIKEVTALMVQGCVQVQSARGPKTQELLELNDKWTRWEQSLTKGSGPSTCVTEY